MALLAMKDMSFSYPGESQSLQCINLTIEQGEFVVLMGQSGCGKTTLLKHFKRELTPAGELKGEIFYNGQLLQELTDREAAAEIGFVLQNPDNQIVTDSVWHELAFGLENLGVVPSTIRRRVAEMAHYFGIQSWFHQKTKDLSGGQKQLLNLAATMVMQPNVLLLDEPTSQLDPIAAKEFIMTLKQLHEELGLTIILIEHRLEEVLALADRVIVLEQGCIIYNGAPRGIPTVVTNQHPLVAALPTPLRVYLELEEQGAMPLTIREGQRWLTQFAKVSEEAAMDNQPVQEAVILEAKSIDFRYEKAGKQILQQFSLQVRRGQLLTIVGGNGTGKSTALQVLAGLLKPQSGEVLLDGKKLKGYKANTLYRELFAVMPQDPKVLFVEKTVALELATMADSFDITVEKVQQVIDQFDLTRLLVRHPYDLSGGEQQKLAFAKLLLREPKILLLDEPTKGLDAHAKHELAGLLKSLQEQGMTIVMVTHDIEFSAQYSDYCALFFDGGVVSEAPPRAFYSGNHFYTTAAHRMARQQFPHAILDKDVVNLCKQFKIAIDCFS